MIYLFDACELDDHNYVLRRAGALVKVEPKVFEVLAYLVRYHDRFVSRDELISQIWPRQVITDAALNRCIAEARKAVGDDGTRQQIIRTQYTRGYRCIASVVERAENQLATEDKKESTVPSTGNDELLLVEKSSPSPLFIRQENQDERIHRPLPSAERAVFPDHSAAYLWTIAARPVIGIVLLGATLLCVRLVFIPGTWLALLPQHLIATLQARLTGKTDAQRWLMQITNQLEAHEHLARGWESYQQATPEANTRARHLFEQALVLHPKSAMVYVGLGWTYWREWTWMWTQDPQRLTQALACAQKALELQPTWSYGYTLQAAVLLMQQHHQQALAAAQHAVTLDSWNAVARTILAEILVFIGRPQEALQFAEQAIESDPAAIAGYAATMGHAYRALGRHEEAIAILQKALTLNPHSLFARMQLLVSYGELGWEEQAWTELKLSIDSSPAITIESVQQRLPYTDPTASRQIVAALQKAGLQ